MICTDFVMLGKTVPEPNSDGRHFVCSAGVSAELKSLIRIYPLSRRNAPARWERCTVPLERNPKDHRHESWKIAGDRSPGAHERINQAFSVREEVPKSDRAGLLRDYTLVQSIARANALRQSLAIVHPRWVDVTFDVASDDDEESPQLCLFDLPGETRTEPTARFRYIPRIRFGDEDGEHNLQVRDWGVYELMRKQGEDVVRRKLHEFLKIGERSSLLVGNQNNRRTSWLVISVLNGIKAGDEAQAGLWGSEPSDGSFIPAKLRVVVADLNADTCQGCGRSLGKRDNVLPFAAPDSLAWRRADVPCGWCSVPQVEEMAA